MALLPGLSVQIYFASGMLDFLMLLPGTCLPQTLDYLSLLVFGFQLKRLLLDHVS